MQKSPNSLVVAREVRDPFSASWECFARDRRLARFVESVEGTFQVKCHQRHRFSLIPRPFHRREDQKGLFSGSCPRVAPPNWVSGRRIPDEIRQSSRHLRYATVSEISLCEKVGVNEIYFYYLLCRLTLGDFLTMRLLGGQICSYHTNVGVLLPSLMVTSNVPPRG